MLYPLGKDVNHMPIPPGYPGVILAILIWGSVSIFVRLADQPAPVIVFARVVTAFLALTLYLRLRGQSIRLQGHWRLAVLSGITLCMTWLFFFKAVQATTIANASLTYFLAPVLSIIWAFFLLGERLEKRALAALGVSGAGICLILSGYEFSLASGDFVGILYCLAAALCYSLAVVMAKKLSTMDPVQLAAAQMAVAAVIFLPVVATDPLHHPFTAVSVLAMILMGLIHSALALALYYGGLRQVKVQHASILSYIEPVSAPFYAFLIFQEVPSLLTLAGGLLIFVASLLTVQSGRPAAESTCNPPSKQGQPR